ncbi:MAG: 16S rRNA (uracil(1498)-N(3))-methyltransferase [Flavobacteriales bacterium]|jgi:16S rRNA (uracil1498-N3)-methyltransferase|nr:16S rRNA (uracil(1498)-N(3))-methyltransferase [Flavobacteriales bacterium]
MHIFYQPQLQDGLLELGEEETRHAVRVLRLNMGDTIGVIDGKGISAKAEITEISKRSCSFRILEKSTEEASILPKIAIAPTKSTDRFEWFLEKAVEIGVSEICPILCSNSERRVLKLDRCEKILLAAMKQSQRNWLPKLHELTPIETFVQNAETPLLLAHCRDGQKVGLTNQLQTDSWIMIGPEGDFTLEEIEAALKSGATQIDLGKSRLRTETAGIFALSVMNYL